MRTSPVAHIFTTPKLISIRSITTFVIIDIRIVLYGYTDPLNLFVTLNIIPSHEIIIVTEPETT